MKCSLLVKTPILWCLHFTKLQFLEKVSPLVHHGYFFSISWIFGIINQITQKDSLKNEVYKFLICSLLQTKHLVITQEKDDRVKVALSYRLQQNVKC